MIGKRNESSFEDDESNAIKRHKEEIIIANDEVNIDAALLNDNVGGDNNDINGNEDHAAAAVAVVATATYDELMQQPESTEADKLSDIKDEGKKECSDMGNGQHHQVVDYEDDEDQEYKDDDKDDDKDDEHDDDEVNLSELPTKRGRKPMAATGTAEWKQQRKDSHKEVERRRRENINSAINKLSDLLPVKESSKAAILARAAEYIHKLKETENTNIEKYTLQKLLDEQKASALQAQNEKLQEELGNAYKEIEILSQKFKDSEK